MSENKSYPKGCRLRKSYDYRFVQSRGVRHTTRHFIVVYLIKNDAPDRLGLTVSRKVGGAVQRNRVKRLLREFYRSSRSCFPFFVDINIIARRGAHKLDLETVRNELLPLFLSMSG